MKIKALNLFKNRNALFDIQSNLHDTNRLFPHISPGTKYIDDQQILVTAYAVQPQNSIYYFRFQRPK